MHGGILMAVEIDSNVQVSVVGVSHSCISVPDITDGFSWELRPLRELPAERENMVRDVQCETETTAKTFISNLWLTNRNIF
jgi:hypothetical protein